MHSSYGPVVQDPYASSGIVYDNGVPSGGNVISDVIIDNGMATGGFSGAVGSGVPTLPPVAGDSFGPRYQSQMPAMNSHMTDQYDRNGDRIIDRQPVN